MQYVHAGRLLCALWIDGSGKLFEKFIGHFLCRAVDKPLTELRKFAADLRLDGIAKQRTVLFRLKLDRRPALGKARYPAVALPRNPWPSICIAHVF
jgi:hypothetical protein